MKKNKIYILLIILLLIIGAVLGVLLYKKSKQTQLASENEYNSNLYEVVNYMQNVETYLAKATISNSNKHAAETLTYLWREANLAQAYLLRLPVESQELEKTAKFLNQVSDYSYSLSRKNIHGEGLTDEELKNLEQLHNYSESLEDTLNQLVWDIENNSITWNDLIKNGKEQFSQSVNSNLDMFNTLEENFHEYSGLIYDGAFSEHLLSKEPKGIVGEEISKDTAKEKIYGFFKDKKIEEIESFEESQNTTIPAYNFLVKTNESQNIVIAISKKGGYVIFSNSNRDVKEQNISYEEANNKAEEFFKDIGIENMEQTYYLNENGVLTINYAYSQNGVYMYPDLIKVKVALDNGEILGYEATGYLNNHIEEREIAKDIISKEEAKKTLNKSLNIQSESLAVIPTEYKTEILCYEFKGKVDDKEFIVYINAKTGEEEDILVIYNTPNGVLTM